MIAVFVLGWVCANLVSSPDIEYRIVRDTKTVTETETVEVATVPKACIDLAFYADKVMSAAGQLDTATADVLAVMAETRMAVFNADGNTMNVLETRLRKINSRTVGASMSIGEVAPDFTEAVTECENAQ